MATPALLSLGECLHFLAPKILHRQIRSLRLHVWLSTACMDAADQVLNERLSTLQELDLHLYSLKLQEIPYSFLSMQDSRTALKSLHVSYALSTENRKALNLSLPGINTLTRFSLGPNLHPDMVRAILETNKLTLREVDCGMNDVVQVVASTATSLTTVALAEPGISASLSHLRQLEGLEILKITVRSIEQSRSVREFLESSPLVPKALHALLSWEILPWWDASSGMSRVSSLVVFPSIWSRHKPFIFTQPLSLPNVVSLSLIMSYDGTGLELSTFKRAWRDSTAPKLRKLTVNCANHDVSVAMSWAEQLKTQRPGLKIILLGNLTSSDFNNRLAECTG